MSRSIRVSPQALSRALVAAAALCLLLAIGWAHSTPLVAMSNDLQGRSLFAAAQLKPGLPASSEISLGNTGILPYVYSLSVAPGLPPGTLMTITDPRRKAPLYRGEPPTAAVALGRLEQRQQVRLRIQILVPAGSRAPGISPSFTWSAAAAGWSAPELWALVLLVLAALFVLAREMLRSRRGRGPSRLQETPGFAP